MNNITKNSNTIKKQNKWTEQINSVLYDNEQLQKQFANDMKLSDKEELAYKLYLYKKNNLDLYHKILSNRYNEIIKPDKKEQPKIQKITLKTKSDKEIILKELGINESFDDFDNLDSWNGIFNDYYKIVKKDDLYIILDLNRGHIDSAYKSETDCLDAFSTLTHDKNYIEDNKINETYSSYIYTKWNMFRTYKYKKPNENEYNKYVVLKIIEDDFFLNFAYNTMLQNTDYEDIDKCIKNIYNAYIKDDKDLIEKMKIHEVYNSTKINEAITDYMGELDQVFDEYEIELTSDENMELFIKNELNNVIENNIDMLKINIETYSTIVKKELFDLFNNKDINEFINDISNTDIQYEDIIDFDIVDENSNINNKLSEVLNISTETANKIIETAISIEIQPFLYIEKDDAITVVYFACMYLIFNNSL